MRRFPGFALGRAHDGALCWRGELASTFDRRRRYRIRVTYSPHFPDMAPVVTIEEPAIEGGTPHLLSAGQPCLFHASDGPRHGYDPARTTAATLVAWTALWIHAYETWRQTGHWPGREH